VKFHPVHASFLFCGSVDGTVCVFDITQNNVDDDALVGGLKLDCEDSVAQLGFFWRSIRRTVVPQSC